MYRCRWRRHQLSVVTIIQLVLDRRTVLGLVLGLVFVLVSTALILVDIKVGFAFVSFNLFTFYFVFCRVFFIARGIRIVTEMEKEKNKSG